MYIFAIIILIPFVLLWGTALVAWIAKPDTPEEKAKRKKKQDLNAAIERFGICGSEQGGFLWFS